jgi:hypothetical protein
MKEQQRARLIRAGLMDLYLELSQTEDALWTARLDVNLMEYDTPMSSPREEYQPSIGEEEEEESPMSDKNDVSDTEEASSGHEAMTKMHYVAENRMEWLLTALTRVENAMSHFDVMSDGWTDAYDKFRAYKALVLRVVHLNSFPMHLHQQLYELGLSGTGIFAIRFWESAVLVHPTPTTTTSALDRLLVNHSYCVAHLQQSRAMLSDVLIPYLRREDPASRLLESLRRHAGNVLSEQMAKLRKLGSLGRHVEFEADDYTSRLLSVFAPDLHVPSLLWTFTPSV